MWGGGILCNKWECYIGVSSGIWFPFWSHSHELQPSAFFVSMSPSTSFNDRIMCIVHFWRQWLNNRRNLHRHTVSNTFLISSTVMIENIHFFYKLSQWTVKLNIYTLGYIYIERKRCRFQMGFRRSTLSFTSSNAKDQRKYSLSFTQYKWPLRLRFDTLLIYYFSGGTQHGFRLLGSNSRNSFILFPM